jgi:imidazole glycerol phosphate synthase glutamine amidotransferase subunit
MSKPEVLVVPTGTANLASVRAGLARAGARTRVSLEPAEVKAAERVVLPGVGAFGPAAERLSSLRLDDALLERVDARRPTLGICLGMQLLGVGSEESPGIQGVSAVSARATRFGEGLRVPQIGWNRIEPLEGAALLEAGYVYFANGYRFEDVPPGWTGATADYGGRFVAAIESGAVLACQFHPELSGAFGLALLRRWIEIGGEAC